jgi:hypothetical protein
MVLETWREVLKESFEGLYVGVASFLPDLIVAIIILLIGWLIGVLIGRVVDQIVSSLKVDDALGKAGVDSLLKRGGVKLDSGYFVGSLVKWFIIIAFLVASFEAIGLGEVNFFLKSVVLSFLPQVIIAVLVLLIGAVLADILGRVVITSAKTAGMGSPNFLGRVTSWSILVFAVLIALSSLGVATAFIQTLFTGVIVALSLALGLAFGLGGQSAAKEYLSKLQSELRK